MRNGLRAVFVAAAIQLSIGCGGGEGDSVPATSRPLVYDCSVFPAQEASEYALPYDVGTSYEANPHAARTPPNATGAGGAQYYAVDLLMPIGTPVVAARSGTVVRIEESFADGDNEVGHENFVVVDHGDGSFARYFHLTNQGALGAIGSKVMRGERMAASGNTGNTSGPHLHFDVVDTRCDVLRGSVTDEFRLCPTVPVSFRNTQASNCGLLAGIAYTALPFQ